MIDNKNNLPEIVVSLTSFPERIGLLKKTLDSICNQTLKADRIVLWLAESQFPNKEKDLPQFFAEYKKFNFEVRWCDEDIRPHKKYYYAFKAFPSALIITIDDDLTYETCLIETLVASWKTFPNAVSAARVHLMTANKKGNILPYNDWLCEFSGVIGIPSMQLFSTSGGGTLYPPNCIDEEVFNIENIKKYCPNADDIWLKIMQVKKGTPVVLAKNFVSLTYVDNTQEIALNKTNVNKGGNDIQLNNLLREYNKDNKFEKLIFEDGFDAQTYINNYHLIKQNMLSDEKQYITQLENDINDYIRLVEALREDIRYLKRTSSKFKKGVVRVTGWYQKGKQIFKQNGLIYTFRIFYNKIKNKIKN